MSAIVKRYVKRILAGEIQIMDVPTLWRNQVIQALGGDEQ